MNSYKKDFENALEMIEWQNTMLRQQQAKLEKSQELLREYTALHMKQQAEIERLIGAEPITYGMLTVCKNCGQQNPYFEKAQEK